MLDRLIIAVFIFAVGGRELNILGLNGGLGLVKRQLGCARVTGDRTGISKGAVPYHRLVDAINSRSVYVAAYPSRALLQASVAGGALIMDALAHIYTQAHVQTCKRMHAQACKRRPL